MGSGYLLPQLGVVVVEVRDLAPQGRLNGLAREIVECLGAPAFTLAAFSDVDEPFFGGVNALTVELLVQEIADIALTQLSASTTP